MALKPFEQKGTPMDKQLRSWRDIVHKPYNKVEVDAFTRCRVIFMNGIETEAYLFSHNFARMLPDKALKEVLAKSRYIEQQQQTTINWLNPADQTILETTVAYEQVAIDLTAFLARHEPDPYVKEVFDFGLLEDFDHLYRYSQMLDIVHGKHPDEILQGKTMVMPGRPTQDHHNSPELRLMEHYQKNDAHPLSKVHILSLLAAEQQTNNFYKVAGPLYGSPELRRLYAEIGQVEEEHVTMYESLIDPNETWLEKWVMHEFAECANYWTCYQTETDARIKQIWEEFLSYEIEHLRIAGDYLRETQGIEPEEICGKELPDVGKFEDNKSYVKDTLETADKRLIYGGSFANMADLPTDWQSFRHQEVVNQAGSPTESVVNARILAEGQELISGADDELAQKASDLRVDGLDAEKALNTAPKHSATPESPMH